MRFRELQAVTFMFEKRFHDLQTAKFMFEMRFHDLKTVKFIFRKAFSRCANHIFIFPKSVFPICKPFFFESFFPKKNVKLIFKINFHDRKP